MNTRNRLGWWIAFGVLFALVLGSSVAVGQFVAGLREHEQIGHSAVGEWADLSEYGFRVRVDHVVVTPDLPNRIRPEERVRPAEGMYYFRAHLTVEVTAESEEDMGCFLDLFNADGEQLDYEDFNVGSRDANECNYMGEEELVRGDMFKSTFVRVVPRDDVENFHIRLQPAFSGEWVYWLFTF